MVVELDREVIDVPAEIVDAPRKPFDNRGLRTDL
jgi:hypothetical protein